MKKMIFLFIALTGIVLSGINVNAQTSHRALLGEWIVESNDAPYEYRKGSVIFSEADGKLIAKLRFPNQTELSVRELKTKDNKVLFTVMIDGYPIAIVLNREGDKMTGKAETPEGVVNIKTERKK